MKWHRIRLLLAIVLCSVLTACSNLKPVATFGSSATALATSYRPFVENMEHYCLRSKAQGTILDMAPYNYRGLVESAKTDCLPITNSKGTALEFATVVEGYGAVLVELAGLKSDALSSDIASLSDAAASLKSRSGDSIFNADAISAASKLASGIVELVLGAKITKVTKKTLADAQAPLGTTVGAMKTFVTKLYPPVLQDYANDMGRVELFLQSESAWTSVPGNNEASADNRRRAVPLRLLQPQVRAELVEVAEQRESIQKFEAACDALLAAHKELIEKFDELTAPDKLAAVKDFVKKAKDLRDSIRKI